MSPTAPQTNDADVTTSWSDDAVLALSQLASVPEEPGVLVLVRVTSETGRADVVVWAEAPDNLRLRARELAGHATVGPELGAILLQTDVRLRYAIIREPVKRQALLERLRDRISTTTSPDEA